MRLVFALLAAMCLTAAAPVPAQRIGLHITVFTMGDHIRLHFHADQPVYEIGMDDGVREEESRTQLRSMQKRQWRPYGPLWLPFDGRLARRDGVAFQDADVDVFTDDISLYWINPVVFPSGGGFVIHNRYLLADQQRFATTVDYRPREREFLYVSGSGTATLEQRDFTREVYLGPIASLSGDPYLRIIAGNDVPGWARARVAGQVSRSVAFFKANLMPLPWPPTLIMAALPETLEKTRPRMMGRATPAGVLTFRFFGVDSLSDSEAGRAELESIAAHEVFHFWDGLVGRPREGNAASWLFEGSADYASMLARREFGQLDGSLWYHELDRHLASCRALLGNQGLGQLEGDAHHRAVYPCGLVVQWITDMAVRHARHTQSGFFEVWRALLVRARAQGGFYQVTDFRTTLAAIDPTALATVDLLFLPDSGDRWAKLRRQMESYGVKTGPAPQGENTAYYSLFQSLARADCTPPANFRVSDGASGLRLEIERPSCRHFGTSTEVRAVEGRPLRLDIYGAYSAMMQKCASSLPVGVTLGDGEQIQVPCNIPMSPLAPSQVDFAVIAMP